jgi:hypothetical protein
MERESRAMATHTLSFTKRSLEWPRIGLDLGVCEDGANYIGFTVYGLPPNGEPERVEVSEPDATDS